MRYMVLAGLLVLGARCGWAQSSQAQSSASQQSVPDLPAAPKPAAKPMFVVPTTVVGPGGELDSKRLGTPPPGPAASTFCTAPSETGMKLPGGPEQQRKTREFIEQVGARIDADWRRHMPRAVNDPWLKSADVLVRYTVRKDGELTDLAVTMTSGRASYDASATRAILESAPFPLPSGLDGPYEMCMRFRYNPDRQEAPPKDPFAPKPAKPTP